MTKSPVSTLPITAEVLGCHMYNDDRKEPLVMKATFTGRNTKADIVDLFLAVLWL